MSPGMMKTWNISLLHGGVYIEKLNVRFISFARFFSLFPMVSSRSEVAESLLIEPGFPAHTWLPASLFSGRRYNLLLRELLWRLCKLCRWFGVLYMLLRRL